MNLFLYAGGNPVNWIDPRGLAADQITQTLPWVPVIGTGFLVLPIPGSRIVGGLILGAYALTTPGDTKCDDDDECDEIRAAEEGNCYANYSQWGPGHWVFQGCMQRASIRWRMCKQNGGSMPSDAPDPWSDADADGWPTIHER